MGRRVKEQDVKCANGGVRKERGKVKGCERHMRIYALISMRTHEKHKLLSMMKRTEKVYGFTQKLESKVTNPLPKGKEALTQ